MSIIEMSWLVSAAIVLHNLEEALWLPEWTAKPEHWKTPMVASEFRFAAFCLSVFVLTLPLAMGLGLSADMSLSILCGYAIAMSVNAIVPHLALSIKTYSYMPGTGTGLFAVIPAGLIFVTAVVKGHQMSLREVIT